MSRNIYFADAATEQGLAQEAELAAARVELVAARVLNSPEDVRPAVRAWLEDWRKRVHSVDPGIPIVPDRRFNLGGRRKRARSSYMCQPCITGCHQSCLAGKCTCRRNHSSEQSVPMPHGANEVVLRSQLAGAAAAH